MTSIQRMRAAFPGLHTSWRAMRSRCTDSRSKYAQWYFEKGISFDPAWNDFLVFAAWALSNGYQPGLTIDRIDNAKGYYPGNCRWVDRKAQARNQTKNRMLSLNGVTRCLGEWAEVTGIRYGNLIARIDRLGWPVEKALTTPTGAIPTGPKRKEK